MCSSTTNTVNEVKKSVKAVSEEEEKLPPS